MSALSVKERAFRLFDEEGPNARSASEWADELGTEPDYIYQLRSEFRDDGDDDRVDAPESDDPTDGDDAEQSDPDPSPSPEQPPSQPQPDPDAQGPVAAAASTDGGSDAPNSGEGPERIDVGHDGQEKLSPEGWDDESTSSIDPPEGVDLDDDVGPDDFEADPAVTPTPDEPIESDPDPDPDPESDDSGSGGGLLGRIRGDSDGADRSTDEIVEDAGTAAERDRRRELLDQLDDSAGATAPPDAQGEGAKPAEAQPGLVVDQSVVESLFRMPFTQAANATGWDGWELTDAEAEANAELFVAWCRENDVDVSTGTMLALSLTSTVGGRAAGYVRYRRQQSDSDPDSDSDSDSTDSGSTDAQPADPTDPTDPTLDGFDFSNPDTW